MTTDELIRKAFDAYNGRDVDALLAFVADDVKWPGESAILRGKDQLRAFWARQWERTRTHDLVTGVDLPADGRAVAHITQTVRSLDGAVLSTGIFDYTFAVEGGLIRRLETRPV